MFSFVMFIEIERQLNVRKCLIETVIILQIETIKSVSLTKKIEYESFQVGMQY